MDVVSLSGEVKNPDLKSNRNAVQNFLYSAEYGTGDSFSSISHNQYQMDVDVVDAMCASS